MTRLRDPAKVAEMMRTLAAIEDDCDRHQRMDALLCQVLDTLGYGEAVQVFNGAKKWYE